jgi:hypothetical protein
MKYQIRHGRSERSGKRFAAIIWRCLTCAFIWLLLSIDALGQGTTTAPSKTACKGWDNAFLTTFHTAFALVLLGTFVLGLALPLLIGRYFWWATASRARILWITLGILIVSVLGVVVYPRFIGLGGFVYSGVNPRYPECAGMQFGASGLFGGLIGRDVAAISQWPAMAIFLFGAAVGGGGLAFLVSEVLVKSLGITSKVSGETT